MMRTMSERLTALDATFLHFERPWTPLHVAGLYIFEGEPEVPGRPGLAGIFRMVEERLPLVPRYRQRVVDVPLGLGQPVWVDDPEFDLAYHLRRAALPAPGGMRELLDYVARVHARPLDRRRPLWEMYVIEGLRGGRMALYTKVHHAMIDGIAGIDLATILLDLDPYGKPAPPRHRQRPQPLPRATQLAAEAVREQVGAVVRGLSEVVRDPRRVASRAVSELTHVAGATRLLSLLRPAPRGPLNVPVGPHRRIALVAVSLARVKAVKNSLGGTVNDVVLAMVGEAIDEFLTHRGITHEEEVYRVLVPVSVRDPSRRMQLGNRVAGMFCDLPVGPMPARRRLAEVTRQMADLKSSRQALAADRLLALSGWAPATLHALAGRLQLSNQRFVNLVVSNVPGPQFPLYAGGCRLLETYPLLPLAANVAVVVCVSSYCGSLYFGLVGDWDAVPDLEVLARGVRHGLDRLEMAAHQATRGRRATGRSAAAEVARSASAANQAPAATPTRSGNGRRRAREATARTAAPAS